MTLRFKMTMPCTCDYPGCDASKEFESFAELYAAGWVLQETMSESFAFCSRRHFEEWIPIYNASDPPPPFQISLAEDDAKNNEGGTNAPRPTPSTMF